MIGISTDDDMVRILSNDCYLVTPGYKSESVIYTDVKMLDIISDNCYVVNPGYRTEKKLTPIAYPVVSHNNGYLLIFLGVLNLAAFGCWRTSMKRKPNHTPDIIEPEIEPPPRIAPPDKIEHVLKFFDRAEEKIGSDDFVNLMKRMNIDANNDEHVLPWNLRDTIGSDLINITMEVEKLHRRMKSLENRSRSIEFFISPHFGNFAISNIRSVLQMANVSLIFMSTFLSLILSAHN